MKKKMQDHAKNLQFEEAQKIKVLIDSIGVLAEKQLARDIIP
jgi:excinuclease UvrABC nuclease subunit